MEEKIQRLRIFTWFQNLQSFGIQVPATGQLEPSGICPGHTWSVSGLHWTGQTFQHSPTFIGMQVSGADCFPVTGSQGPEQCISSLPQWTGQNAKKVTWLQEKKFKD